MTRARTPLPDAVVADALARAPGWSRGEDGALQRARRFPTPAAAFGFVSGVALLAERHDHHPELRWVFRDVELRLVTHDAGDAVTMRDVELMLAIAELP